MTTGELTVHLVPLSGHSSAMFGQVFSLFGT